MSFWDLSDGDSAKNTGTEYDTPAGNFEPIPDNSKVLAMVDAVKWQTKEHTGKRYLEITWTVLAPEEFKNRKIFHNLWVDDLDPNAKSEDKAKEKRDKARRRLAQIDALCGGKLTQSNDAPTDDAMMMALGNRQLVIQVMMWEMDDRERYGEKIRGNWVNNIYAPSEPTSTGKAPPPAQKQQVNGGTRQQLDDEIPF